MLTHTHLLVIALALLAVAIVSLIEYSRQRDQVGLLLALITLVCGALLLISEIR